MMIPYDADSSQQNIMNRKQWFEVIQGKGLPKKLLERDDKLDPVIILTEET